MSFPEQIQSGGYSNQRSQFCDFFEYYCNTPFLQACYNQGQFWDNNFFLFKSTTKPYIPHIPSQNFHMFISKENHNNIKCGSQNRTSTLTLTINKIIHQCSSYNLILTFSQITHYHFSKRSEFEVAKLKYMYHISYHHALC